MNEKSKYFPLVDLAKLVAAILVVCIHTGPLGDISSTLNHGLIHCIARLAVPFFFVVTGYFLFENCEDTKRIKPYLLKIFKLYIIWTVIYIPLNIIELKSQYQGEWIKRFVINIFFDGSYIHLWYLRALLVGVVILFVLMRYTSTKITVAVAAVLYLFGLLTETYINLFDSTFLTGVAEFVSNTIVTTRNGTCFAFPFLTLGLLIRKNKSSESMVLKKKIICFILSLVLYVLEALIVQRYHLSTDYNRYITLPLVTYFILIICLDSSLNQSKMLLGKNTSLVRNLSSLVYYIHPLIIYFIPFKEPRLLYFAAVTAASLLVSFGIFKLSKINKLSILKKLYK